MAVIALLWGLAALAFAFVAFLPFVGILNWLVIPFAAVGVILGYVTKTRDSAGRFGFIASLIALVIGMFRLSLGGGIF